MAGLFALAASRVLGHGVPADLDIWGAFGLPIAHCQRVIGSGGAACALEAWRIRRTCAIAQMRGDLCDTAAADAAVEQAHHVPDDISAFCTDDQVKQLQFLGVYEAQSDAVRSCRDLEAAATSAVFDPLPSVPTALGAAQRACVESAALATTKLLSFAFRDRQRLLDLIAIERSLSPPQKHALVQRSTRRIAAAAATLSANLQLTCPADTFRALYQTDPDAFLALIATRGDCLAGATYAQGGLLCPPAVCGNGMKESGEDCDDHNLIDGDGCSATCTRE